MSPQFAVSIVLVASLLFVGCAEDTVKTETVVSAEPGAEEPLPKTSGRVAFEGIPTHGMTAREVIVVEALEPAARERLRRQRQLFEYKATGHNTELEEAERMAQVDLSPEDAKELDQKLIDLRFQFPEPLTLDVRIEEDGVDDDRIRKVTSDYALQEDYQELFRAIRWDNMKRGVEFIGEKLETDVKAWADKRSAEDAFEAKQAFVTLKWLDTISEHLNAYVALANERIRAVNAHAAKWAEAGTKAYTWEDYVDRFGAQLIIDISKEELASAEIGEDGTFEVDAQGDLLVRLEYGFRSAYFLVGAPEENRVTVTDFKVLDGEPAPDP